jgi:KDO2-lipid IV(A) lauroyltransferase
LYYALRSVVLAMTCFGVRDNLTLAATLGDLMWAIDKKHRQRALDNIAASFPDLPEKQRRKLARESMHQFFALFVEVVFTPRQLRLETLARHVDLSDFSRTLRLLLDEHRGMMMLTGHYGNWEVLGYVLGLLGFETTSVARPLDNKHINAWLLNVREEQGQKIVDKKGATPDITAAMDRHGTLGFIADQDAGKKGLFVDFFGRPASTYKSIGLVAMQYEVPIVVGFARRRRGKFEFEVGIEDVIEPIDWQDQPDPLRYITQRYTKAIEQFVSAAPGQYLWVHRRWKTQPRVRKARVADDGR